MTHLRRPPRHLAATGKIEVIPFRSGCCWPGCEQPIGVIDAPLCKPHLVKIYAICQDVYLWSMEPEPHELVATRLKSPPSKRFRAIPEQGVVYFVRLGSLVKIGFSTNLASRMREVPHEEILGTVPGTMQDEKRCHAAFAHLRVTGEWFKAEPELLAFVKDVAA